MAFYISSSVIGNMLSWLLLLFAVGIRCSGTEGKNLAISVAAILSFLITNSLSAARSPKIKGKVRLALLFDK